jgi:predicted PurR-regulated permease PerM
LIIAGVASIAAIALLWYLFDVLLLLFASVLLAVMFRAPSAWVASRTRLSSSWSLALVLLLILALVGSAAWLLGAAVAEQARAIAQQAPQMLERVQDRVQDYGWLAERLDDADEIIEGQERAFVGRGLSVVSATFGAIANVGLVIFMAVLLAAQPDLYVRGTLRLVPLHRRSRIGEVLHCVGDTLRRWLLGQLCLMLFVALCSTFGLWLLDVPYALALGLLAGLLTFVPFIGPLFAAAVAILVSLAEGVAAALSVAALYAGIQIVEGLLEPLVQQRAVYLPPVLLLATQLSLGVLVGFLGVVLATPLAAAAMVAVQMLYVRDVLGDSD